MQQRNLLQLLPPRDETDYLDHFRCLATVNVEIQKNGATPERLLRKSILEMEVGNFSAGLEAARDASDVRPTWSEAHYQQGMALLHLAFVRAGILAGSAGMERPVGSCKTLLEHAGRAFGEALRLHAEDEEVKDDLKTLSMFLAANPDADDVREAMQGLKVT